MSGPARLDVWLFRQGNLAAAPHWLDAFFVWLTAPPEQVYLMVGLWLLLAALGGVKGRRTAVAILLLVGATDFITSSIVKHLVFRMRPCFVLPNVRLLLPHQAHSPSFPSAHAANTTATAVLLFGTSRALGWIGVVLAALISYSRIYVGVHYPSDVLGGAVIGFAIGRAGLFVLRRWDRIRSRLVTLSRRFSTRGRRS